MSNPDSSIDPRILESAMHAFLKNGFEKTALKEICFDAGITTGALYKRYRSKEDLFCSMVASTVRDLDEVAQRREEEDVSALSDEELTAFWDIKNGDMKWWFDFLYERKDGFTLLLKCSEGTRYDNFSHDWVVRMTKSARSYLDEALRRGLATVPVNMEELHILLTAFWTTIYEPFIHGFSKEQIDAHCALVCNMFNWHKTFGFVV